MSKLLSPLSPESPTGLDLSFSPEFDQITELRRFDDPTLDQGDWVRDIKGADWPGVVRLCTELLSSRTKDLRLAGWMTEALARSRGFAGMAEGLNVCAGLCESFWDGLHPLPDEDAPADEPAERFEQRIGNLSWLLKQLAEVAQTQPLILGKASTGNSGVAYGRRIIEAVRSRKASEYESTTEPTEEQIALALAQTPGPALLASLDGTQAALQALARLQAVIDGQLGVSGPNFSATRDALKDTQHMLTRFAKDRGLLQANAGEDATSASMVPMNTPTSASGAATTPAGSFSSAAPATRAQALAQLRAVAEFFRRTEPHSPVAYLADKAARWGEVPLHQWLRSVLKDQNSLAQIEEMLGIEPPPEA